MRLGTRMGMAVLAPGLLLPVLAACDDSPAPAPDKPRQSLAALVPAGEKKAVTGSGQLEENVANTIPGHPARDGTVEFLFTCTGGSVMAVSVRDGGRIITGATGSQKCDGAVFRASLPVTTQSRLSFRADATSFVEGGQFSFAYLGEFI
jgi:hypothetical protein